jgi:glycosyltransferase involved in cell wall biosynthesis
VSLARSARLALDLLTAEGPASLARRALDRLAEGWSKNAYTPALDWPRDPAIPTLHVSATPPAPRLGGVQTQLVARRLRERTAGRPFALLYPLAGRYRLEVERGAERAALDLGPTESTPTGAPPELEPGAWVRAVRDAYARCGASNLRIEGAAGLPLAGLLELASTLPLALALHDFALFCPRPHLAEEPAGTFCDYSRDFARCALCLQQSWPVDVNYQPLRRKLAARLLSGVERTIFPSAFLLRAHLELFPTLDAAHCRVEPPPLLARPVPGYRPQDPPRRIAFVGAAKRFKGTELFAEVVAALSPSHPEIEWHTFGGGDPALLRKLREAGVLVHGYYRAGTLPAQLARQRIDLALLLSIVPESYGLTLDECALARVPFLTFDLGAQAERADALGGRVVPLAEGAEGVAARIAAAMSSGDPGNPRRRAGLRQ